MPKNTLGRRQPRQANLLLLNNSGEASDSIFRGTPRQVSDEDIKANSDLAWASPRLDGLDDSMHSKRSLKRPSPTPCLVDLMVPSTPPSRLDSSESLDGGDSTSSPWGHFVDLFQNDARQTDTSCASSVSSSVRTRHKLFSATRIAAEPYPVLLKRQRVQSPTPITARVPRVILGGNILPRPCPPDSTAELLQDALKNLSV